MHKTCKYSFESTIKKTKSTYSGLEQQNVNIEYEEKCTRCGLKALSVVILKNQPLCSDFVVRE